MTVDVTTDARVMRITLDDQATRNALSPDLVSAVRSSIVAANADDAVRVIVLTNRGSVFCSGANMKHQSSDEGRASGRVGGGFEELLLDMTQSATPIVGRIAGHALGGGVGLAAACDISVADRDAKFGFTEVRLGLSPAIISVVCLPKMRGGEAMEAFLRGNRFDGAHAAGLGIVNRAVAADDLDAAVAEIVSDLLLGGPRGMAATKRLVHEVPALATAEAFRWTAELSAALFGADEGREGMAAFIEKRDPDWR
ncbi:MAG TPA: enoyl-CoA hydratase-related protein [Acidimicrobiales bacterium]|nr:enoyl-CoA hydratase-related protein [Acidimicrobiales bacterium]